MRCEYLAFMVCFLRHQPITADQARGNQSLTTPENSWIGGIHHPNFPWPDEGSGENSTASTSQLGAKTTTTTTRPLTTKKQNPRCQYSKRPIAFICAVFRDIINGIVGKKKE
ncbi:uncharacterized protein LOC115624316 [Scaptodrosophila lebanonensis]|uniref:Uncharacterized protein LOC115624316 n=1 Tax=Drosophila lebanonensis TaxID=7225 RepID=A0A6J2TH83_DROLE|nr:uncharacterized protein LOC115624316 [Scaptodrosophila lebanonensis]